VSAVNEIHNDPQGTILHRDIKPKNIMLDKNSTVKLTNFSLLRRLNPEEEFSMTFISGSYYRSPEQITSGIYSTQSDIWALGCLLFEMTTLRPPFKQNSEYLTAKSIQ
jgi:NIMA (never in mitosis gene a)-related kinase